MPQTPHIERHFTAGETVRDIVIGMSDGLTVPFALAAGLSGAVSGTRIVVTAGMAEVAAGSIAMGLGGYLAARSDAEHYASERVREERETLRGPRRWRPRGRQGLHLLRAERGGGRPDRAGPARPSEGLGGLHDALRAGAGGAGPAPRPDQRADHRRGLRRRGLIPLSPYFLLATAHGALLVSVGVTLVALLVFGYVKGRFTGAGPLRSGLQTAIIGGLAAAAAFLIARAIT